MRKLLINLFLLCTGKDGIEMMAMLWAQEIMNQETVEDAKKMYERVPRLLKTKVKDILIRSGTENYIKAMVTHHGLAVVYQRTEQQDAGTD